MNMNITAITQMRVLRTRFGTAANRKHTSHAHPGSVCPCDYPRGYTRLYFSHAHQPAIGTKWDAQKALSTEGFLSDQILKWYR